MESQPPEKPRHPLERPLSEAENHPTYNQPATVAPAQTGRRIEIPRSAPLYAYIILGINIVVFLIDMLLDQRLTLMGGKWNPAIINGQYWRLVTHMFLHGGIVHLGLNGYFLYVFGSEVERAFGPFRFLAIYFLSGIAGGLLSFIGNPDSLSVGASGALFGLIGAMLPLLYRNRNVLANTRGRIMSLIQTIVINLVLGFTIPNIDWWAHIGGLVMGLALAWLTTPRYSVQLDMMGAPERVVDASSLQIAWLWYVLFGFALIMTTGFLIWMNNAPSL